MIDYSSQDARVSRTRGRINGTGWGMAYPSPFFDIAHTYLPDTMKKMFRWCRYYALTNPLVASVVYKMAEYPITDIIIDTDNEGTKKLWASFFEDTLRLRSFLVDIGLFYMTYGNALVSVNYPFRKFLVCRNCKKMVLASKAKFKFRSFKFFLECGCGAHQEAEVKDIPVRSPNEIRLILWSPEDIDIKYNDLTGKSTYYYSMPSSIKNDITMGRREVVTETPQIFIDAIRKQKSIVLNPDNIFHFRRPSILTTAKDKAWGVPLILPVLKDVFYLQVLKKAQECVSLDTRLETPSGMVPADEVAIGDLVRTHTGNWRKVEKKWYRECHQDEIGRRITVSNMKAVPSTYSPNHPVFALIKNGDGKGPEYTEILKPAGMINVGDFVLYPRGLPELTESLDIAKYTSLYANKTHVYSSEYSDDDVSTRVVKRGNGGLKKVKRHIPITIKLGYVLGLYAGSGVYSNGKASISPASSSSADGFCRYINETFELSENSTKVLEDESQVKVVVNDVIVSKVLDSLISGTHESRVIPEVVLNAPSEVKISFLRGLFETCGHISSDKVTISARSFDFVYGVFALLTHIRCFASITASHSIYPSSGLSEDTVDVTDYYSVEVTSSSKGRLFNLTSNKPAKEVSESEHGFFWGKHYLAVRVCAVEEAKEAMYIDFKVEKDTTFCTPGIATKNSIALERIVPLTVLFPQPGSGSSDPYSTISLSKWRDQVGSEVQRWRLDRNYIPILSLPIGSQNIGGDGRALLLGQEIRIWSEHIIAGMGVPQEFVMGGLQFSGSNVSLRMLENQFLRYVSDQLRMIKNFVVKNVAAWMDWPMVNVRFKPFKMADDLQRRAFDFQLNQAGKLSDTSLLANCDYDPIKEDEQMAKETVRRLEAVGRQQRAEAQIAVDAQTIQAKGQAKVQQIMAQEQQQAMQGQANAAPGEAQEGQQQQPSNSMGGSSGGGTSSGGAPNQQKQAMAQQMAQRLVQYPPDQQQQIVQQIAQQDPELAQMVESMLKQQQASPQSGIAGQPQPEQLPARRGPESASI